MTDSETITLLGGPADGKTVQHDGGDFIELEAPSLRTIATDPMILRNHVYRRAIYRRDIFTWQGARS
ncbi:hypothetical protein [Sphingobium lignivorans]|uniref:Uncharacterized protein n=1 Tax=Sphingobium lignivorans TaxID=2735886 RepID=A0ABR6NIE7_9SPHN|nr:hypothetical protein [Sphingobium lignivorans]MBB5985959.1 hypothetical protein [Sphingobium lignivorans]